MPAAAIIVGLVMLLLMGGGQAMQITPPATASGSAISVASQLTGGTPTVSTTQTASVTTATTPTVSVAQSFVPPRIDTLSAWNLYSDRATIRTELTYLGETYKGNIFLIYSTNKQAVMTADSNLTRYADLVEKNDFWFSSIINNVQKSGVYSKQLYQLSSDTQYFYTTCFEATVVTCGGVESFTTNESYNLYGTYQYPTAISKQAESIMGTSAELSGTYYLNSAKNASAFFVYGTDRALVTAVSTFDTYSDVQESGDKLQKVRAGSNIESNGSRDVIVDELEKNTTYYQRFCVAFDDDEETAMRCGSVLTFTTKKRDYDIPTFRNQSALVAGHTIAFNVTADMEDYTDGYLFLVYGTVSAVTSVSDRSRFIDVYQNGTTLQRVAIDADFDGSNTVQWFAKDIPSGDYAYRFCTQYETENNYGWTVQALECSDVALFSVL